MEAIKIYISNRCKIGKSALQKKKELFEIQQKKILEARKKEEAKYMDNKRKYDAIMVLNIDDEKLSGNQLKSLLDFKKWKADKGFSSMKKKELLQLWKEWKAKLATQPEYDNNIVESVAEVSHDTTLIDNSTLNGCTQLHSKTLNVCNWDAHEMHAEVRQG